jgi:hypothetical protein
VADEGRNRQTPNNLNYSTLKILFAGVIYKEYGYSTIISISILF